MRAYDFSFEEAEQFIDNREGICEICGTIALLVIDHCHTTDEVGGKVCSACNSMLGYARDNTKTLTSAIKYLDRFYNDSKI